MDTEFPSRRKIMEISGGEGSTERPPGMENPGDGDQTGKKPPRRVWIFSGTTH